jgi:Short C-terminal domain
MRARKSNLLSLNNMKRNLFKWLLLLSGTSLIGLSLFSSGCAWQLGGDKTGTSIVQPTRGQELVDLKKAKDQGAITDNEYQAQRNKILAR